MTGITMTQEKIGPAEAKALMATNDKNRNLRPDLITKFTHDIEAGRWVLNGETIKIDATGQLIDGQHRLAAVIKSNESIDTLVVRGLPASVQETIDSGASRTFGDLLKLRGEHHYYTLAAITRMAWLISTGGKPTAGGFRTPTFGDMSAYLAKNPDMRTLAPMAVNGPRSALRLPGSLVGALAYHMQLLDRDLGQEFWRQLFENDAKKGSAVHTLREQLIKDTKMPHRMSVPYRAAIIIKAWNAWLESREPGYIAFKPSEDFPRLHGPFRSADVAV